MTHEARLCNTSELAESELQWNFFLADLQVPIV